MQEHLVRSSSPYISHTNKCKCRVKWHHNCQKYVPHSISKKMLNFEKNTNRFYISRKINFLQLCANPYHTTCRTLVNYLPYVQLTFYISTTYILANIFTEPCEFCITRVHYLYPPNMNVYSVPRLDVVVLQNLTPTINSNQLPGALLKRLIPTSGMQKQFPLVCLRISRTNEMKKTGREKWPYMIMKYY